MLKIGIWITSVCLPVVILMGVIGDYANSLSITRWSGVGLVGGFLGCQSWEASEEGL